MTIANPEWPTHLWARAAVVADQCAKNGRMPYDSRREMQNSVRNDEALAQCSFLQDIFGAFLGPLGDEGAWLPHLEEGIQWCLLPTPRPIVLRHECLLWNDGLVVKLAQAVYDEEAFDRLPVLADALEEAGCTGAGILDHCRQPGTHTRGCWVLDYILGNNDDAKEPNK